MRLGFAPFTRESGSVPDTHTASFELVSSIIAASCASISRADSSVVWPGAVTLISDAALLRVINSFIESVISAAFSATEATSPITFRFRTSDAPCNASEPPPATAPPPKNPTKPAFSRRKFASASVNVSSISIRLRIEISSWTSSVDPSIKPPLPNCVPNVFASLPITELGPADFDCACLLSNLSRPTSPNKPTAACGRATNPARTAARWSSSLPDSNVSLTLEPASGAYSEVPAPRSAPWFLVFFRKNPLRANTCASFVASNAACAMSL